MAHRNYPLNYTSADLEKAAVNRFRSLVVGLPQQCIVFRDLWDRSTVLCLDFADCPHLSRFRRKKDAVRGGGEKVPSSLPTL